MNLDLIWCPRCWTQSRGCRRFSQAEKSNDVNVELANSLKMQLLQVKMDNPSYGPERVVAALKNLASEITGQVYQVL